MRPENLKYPQVYYKFKAKDSKSENIIEYRVQDLPEELFEEALRLYFTDYFPDEFMTSSRKYQEKEFDSNDCIKFWRKILNENLSLVCFKNDESDNEIVALNALGIYSEDDDDHKVDDPEVQDMLDSMAFAFKQANTYEKYGIKKYLGSYGLVVNRKYRGRGIATQMLEGRKFLLEALRPALGLNLTSTLFTMSGSQKSAKKAGFVEEFVMSNEDLAKVSSRFRFEDGFNGGCVKVMSFKINS